MSKNTAAFFIQAAVAFGVSFVAALGGIFFLPLDAWQRLFLGITVLFLVSSAFTLAKVIRDQQEAATVRSRSAGVCAASSVGLGMPSDVVMAQASPNSTGEGPCRTTRYA